MTQSQALPRPASSNVFPVYLVRSAKQPYVRVEWLISLCDSVSPLTQMVAASWQVGPDETLDLHLPFPTLRCVSAAGACSSLHNLRRATGFTRQCPWAL